MRCKWNEQRKKFARKTYEKCSQEQKKIMTYKSSDEQKTNSFSLCMPIEKQRLIRVGVL